MEAPKCLQIVGTVNQIVDLVYIYFGKQRNYVIYTNKGIVACQIIHTSISILILSGQNGNYVFAQQTSADHTEMRAEAS